jgi:ABC-2 type transport system ATP-binding protein
MIRIQELTKKFKDVTAVNAVTLTIKKGEIFGLLGPNGAGKTTMIQILCGLLTPTSGSLFFGEYDLKKHMHRIKK